jgi:hyperosmotically inducible periplasmic protein
MHRKATRTLNQAGRAAFFLGASFVLGSAVMAQAPDNSRTNRQEREKGTVSADQQGENQADRDLAKKVRKSLSDDKSLSIYAHNVKVVARNGTVTLLGPVRSEEEKAAITAKASEIAGAENVKSELTVKSKNE